MTSSDKTNTANKAMASARGHLPLSVQARIPKKPIRMDEWYDPPAYYIARRIYRQSNGFLEIILIMVPIEDGHDRKAELDRYGRVYRASCIDLFDWECKTFYLGEFSKMNQPGTLVTTEYLALPDGIRVTIDKEKIPLMENLLINTYPLWDEFSILRAGSEVHAKFQQHDVATWHDQVVQKLQGRMRYGFRIGRPDITWVAEERHESLPLQNRQYYELDLKEGVMGHGIEMDFSSSDELADVD